MLNEIIYATAPPPSIATLYCLSKTRAVDGWGTKSAINHLDLFALMVSENPPTYEWFRFYPEQGSNTATLSAACDGFSLDNVWFGGDVVLKLWADGEHPGFPLGCLLAEYHLNGFLPDQLKTFLKRYA